MRAVAVHLVWLIFSATRTNTTQAQQPLAEPKPGTTTLAGTVVGRVVYAETQLPARFAEVTLVHKPADAELKPINDDAPANGRRTRQQPEPASTQVVSLSRRTALDGSYRIDDVPAGDYLLLARMPGYLIPGAQPSSTSYSIPVQQLIASLPSVHVVVGQVASADLTLHRGAVLGGQVRFADGSPVIGVQVEIQPAVSQRSFDPALPSYLPLQNALRANSRTGGFSQEREVTNDEGRYRISGLVPGRYLVTTLIETDQAGTQILVGDQRSLRSTGNRGAAQPMRVYSPGVFRRKDARVFEIRADEQVLDADLKVDPSGLHTVSGKLVAGEDRHPPAQATVRLIEAGAAATGEMGRLAQSGPDGSFQIQNVPAGSYTLLVLFASDDDLSGPKDEASKTGIGSISGRGILTKVYKAERIPVLIGEHDVTLDEIVLTLIKPGLFVEPDPPQ